MTYDHAATTHTGSAGNGTGEGTIAQVGIPGRVVALISFITLTIAYYSPDVANIQRGRDSCIAEVQVSDYSGTTYIAASNYIKKANRTRSGRSVDC